MLTITIPEMELFNDDTNEFIMFKKTTLQLEHSLVSISKWESKWEKPFMSPDKKSIEETVDYIRCMTMTQHVEPGIYNHIPGFLLDEITNYINAKMTATWIKEEKTQTNNRLITSELIYYWMIINNIPMECQKWHLNRLLMLIRVCNSENNPPTKKKNTQQSLAERTAINNARKNKLNSKG